MRWRRWVIRVGIADLIWHAVRRWQSERIERFVGIA